MREEFVKLEQILSQDMPINMEAIETILNESLGLFEKLKDVAITGTAEEKNEMIRLVNRLNMIMQTRLELFLNKSGLSKDQFAEILSDPKHFTKDQWTRMESAKKTLDDKKKLLLDTFAGVEASYKKAHAGISGKAPAVTREAKLQRAARPSRQKWMKN